MPHIMGSGMGHGGGHAVTEAEETAGNNLSYPVIFTDGVGLVDPLLNGFFSLATPYDVDGDGDFDISDQSDDGYYWFAQKEAGNAWQADTLLLDADADPLTNLFVSTIDWGDSIEGGKPIAVGRPTRIEVSFYKDLSSPLEGDVALESSMSAFDMMLLANPSSPSEVQGVYGGVYPSSDYPISGQVPSSDVRSTESSEASVYSHAAELALQYVIGTPEADDFAWNGSYWVDADLNDAVSIEGPIGGLSFGGEITVGGKVVYGLSQGGWRPEKAGTYRATVFFPTEGNLQLGSAVIAAATEEVTAEPALLAAEVDEPVAEPVVGAQVDGVHNLSYLDIFVEGNQPPVVAVIEQSVTEDDPAFSVDLLSMASDPEGDPLAIGNVIILASDGVSPVVLPAGAAVVQGSDLLITPSALGYLVSGESILINTSFSVSDGVNTVPSSALITVQGLDEAVLPPDTGGGSSGGQTAVLPVGSGAPGMPATSGDGADGGFPPSGESGAGQNQGSVISGRGTIRGSDQGDLITGSGGKDRIFGDAGDDRLRGRGGNDKIYGEDGDDVLRGGSGKDLLDGGEGFDVLIGGSGRDRYRINLEDGVLSGRDPDLIKNFNLRKDKVILGSGIDRGSVGFSDGYLTALVGGEEVLLARLGGVGGGDLINQIQFS